MQALETKFPRPMGVFESALSAAVTTDSTGTGTGTITWTLADISAYYADIVPAGETLKLTYTVTVKDSQGATSQSEGHRHDHRFRTRRLSSGSKRRLML